MNNNWALPHSDTIQHFSAPIERTEIGNGGVARYVLCILCAQRARSTGIPISHAHVF